MTAAPLTTSQYSASLIPNLMARYDFEQDTNTSAIDSSGRGNNGVFVRNPIRSQIAKIGLFSRLFNSSLRQSISLSLFVNSSAETRCFWINTTSAATSSIFSSGTRSGLTTLEVRIVQGFVELALRSPFESAYIVNSSGLVVNDGRWHHVACVISSGTVQLFVDGAVQASSTVNPGLVSSILYSVTNADIGRRQGSTALFYDGLLDDVRYYSRALSANEISFVGEF